jgi:prepilin-type N-terminal cleavage/methylation domain-containing protein
MPRQRRPAYTLFELVLVIALIGILLGLTYPSVDAMYAHLKLKAAADAVRGALATARAHAMDDARSYRFAVVANQGNYRVAPDGSEFWSGGEPPAAGDSSSPPLLLEDALPRGIAFTLDASRGGSSGGDTILPPGSVDPGQWSRVVAFLPDGTATEDVQITLQLNARVLVLRLRALTGVVTVQEPGRP